MAARRRGHWRPRGSANAGTANRHPAVTRKRASIALRRRSTASRSTIEMIVLPVMFEKQWCNVIWYIPLDHAFRDAIVDHCTVGREQLRLHRLD